MYAYDRNGNRTRKEHFQAGDVDWAETYCYNERNQLTERRNREGVSRYLYDPEGNLLKEKNGEKESVYRYDLLNRQTYLRTMEGREQENRYDGEGLRAGTVENGKAYTFLYHNEELLAECDGDGAAISRHVRGHDLSHIQTMGDSRYHVCHRDEQGSTAYLTGEDGSVENSCLYDAFGNELESLEGIRNRIKYTGQQYDPETGQYYLRARYYNPLIGRFTQEDTYRGDGLNLYAYCGNNPVVYFDPSGFAQQEYGKQGAKKQSDSPAKKTRVRHYTNRKGLKGIEAKGEIIAQDNNRVYVEPANKKPLSPVEAESKYELKAGKGRDYVEFDVESDKLEWVKNPRYHTQELTVKGNVKVKNAKYTRRK